MKLYSYDHCPYCIKARMIFGFKNLEFDLITIPNDEEEVPIGLVGKKIVPILVDGDIIMPESMDIIHYIDSNYGNKVLLDNSPHSDLEDWLAEVGEYLYKLTMPRWVNSCKDGFMEEFESQSAREYFTRKKTLYIGDFEEHLSNSEEYIIQVNKLLLLLEDFIDSQGSIRSQLSESDIHLFAVLRSLSIVKGLEYPKKVEDYRQKMSHLSQIKLHDSIAI